MFVRSASIAIACLFLGACAQTPMIGAPSFGTGSLQAVSPVKAGEFSTEMQKLGHPTLAGKVLTAIALERVTGMKPDPARFSDLD